MAGLSLSQKYALRAAFGASRCMLVKIGNRYSTDFFGGSRINIKTVESLIACGLMQRVEGGPSVTLTASGRMVAEDACRENEQAGIEANRRTTNWRSEKARARGPYRRSFKSSPELKTARLPYADN